MKSLSSAVRKQYDQPDVMPAQANAGAGSQVARVYGLPAARTGAPEVPAPGAQPTTQAPARKPEDEAAATEPAPETAANENAPAAPGGPEASAGDQNKPGFFRRLGQGLWNGVKKTGALAWQGISGAYGLGLKAVHAVANLTSQGVGALGRGAEQLGTNLGADRQGAAGWVGKGVRGAGQGLQSGAQGTRNFFGLDQDGNDFTGHVDIPKDKEGKHVQQYSELGLPMTEDAWAMQNAIDEGKLAEIYDQTLLSSLQAGGVLHRLVEEGVVNAEHIPESFDELSPDELDRLITAIREEVGSGRAFLDALTPEEREEFQEQVIQAYMRRAKSDENAAFMLELMPTDTSGMFGQVSESTGDAMIRGQGPNDFKVGEEVGKIRQGAVNMADSLRAQGDSVYALPVPYANTVPNIIGRTGVPRDGADHMHNYMRHLGPDMKTVATGYSQGGAAVLDYAHRYGDSDGLDYMVALAPMGGADRQGGTGVWSGENNGIKTLSVMHEGDPAHGIHGDYLADLVDPMWTFVDNGRQQKRGLDGALHSGYYGDSARPLPEGVNGQEAMGAGTLGYPTAYVAPMLDDLFSDRQSGQEYQRRGDWRYDLREELVHNGENGQLDPSKVKRDPRKVADQYLP